MCKMTDYRASTGFVSSPCLLAYWVVLLKSSPGQKCTEFQSNKLNSKFMNEVPNYKIQDCKKESKVSGWTIPEFSIWLEYNKYTKK